MEKKHATVLESKFDGMDYKGIGSGVENVQRKKFVCYVLEMERKWNGKINDKSSGENFY